MRTRHALHALLLLRGFGYARVLRGATSAIRYRRCDDDRLAATVRGIWHLPVARAATLSPIDGHRFTIGGGQPVQPVVPTTKRLETRFATGLLFSPTFYTRSTERRGSQRAGSIADTVVLAKTDAGRCRNDAQTERPR